MRKQYGEVGVGREGKGREGSDECNIMYCTSSYSRVVRYDAVHCLLALLSLLSMDVACLTGVLRASSGLFWSWSVCLAVIRVACPAAVLLLSNSESARSAVRSTQCSAVLCCAVDRVERERTA